MVTSPPELVRKYPGFSAVLTSARRGSRNWSRARTGVLLLDLVDRRLSRDRSPAASVHHVVAIRRATSAVTPGTVRHTMRSVITLVVDRSTPAELLSALDDVGRQLNHAGHHRLAYGVYRFMIARARSTGAGARLPQWYEDLGYCLREDNRWEDATEAYRRGLECAEEHCDEVARFRLCIAQAHIYRTLRQFERAQGLLVSARARAEALGRPDLVVRGCHESGVLAHDCGRLAEALAFYRQALHASGYGDEAHRHRLMLDIARALADAEYRDVAREAFGVLLMIARERSTRWLSALNLLDLAVRDHDPWRFDHYRQMLARAPMTTPLRTFYHECVAEGGKRFGGQAMRAKPETDSRAPQASSAAIDPATIAELVGAIRDVAHAPRRRVDSRRS